MAKKEQDLLKDGATLISEMSGLVAQMWERLYARDGTAWQFRDKVEDVQLRARDFVQEAYPKQAPKPEPEPEPTVGSEEEEPKE